MRRTSGAAGEGHLVGGDFYDMFDAGDGVWGLACGDVAGKGARAASLTALARYTLRTAATLRDRPSEVLAELNDAILREHESEEFCAAVYARFELGGPNPALTVASAGHPLPLLVRARGGVEELGEPGVLLGVGGEAELSDTRVELGAGDVVVLFTDGLTDAYAPRQTVHPAEIAAIVRGAAGLGAEGVVSAIRDALLDGPEGEPRDDIAIVAIGVSPSAGT